MIIQRIQSLFLLITVVMMSLFSFCSLAQFNGEFMQYSFSTMGICSVGIPTNGGESVNIPTWWLFAISILTALITLVNIFLFKNPKRQRTICNVIILFIIAIMAICCYLGYTAVPNVSPSWSSIIIAPVIAIISTIMAYRYIGKDMRLLSSINRLR